MSDLLRYDGRIWREIEATVEPKMAGFLTKIQREIADDRSLDRLPSKQQIIWQRADGWLQGVYDICCDAYRNCGHEVSIEFDCAVWAFCLEPFILVEEGRPVSNRARLAHVLSRNVEEPFGAAYIPSLVELLLCASGSPLERSSSSQHKDRQNCLNIRYHLHEAWRKKLLHLTTSTQLEEAAAALSRYNALEARAKRVAAGLPPEPPPQAVKPEPDQHAAALGKAAAPTTVDTQLSPRLAAAPTTPEDAHLGNPAPESTQRPRRASAATWEEVKIVFTSDHQVQIWCSKNTEILNYAEFGFADRRSGNPNQAWLLLRVLAEHRGIIRNGKEAGQAWPKVEKRIQEIRAVLRSHFGLFTDPIPFLEGTGYQACFKISCAPSYKT